MSVSRQQGRRILLAVGVALCWAGAAAGDPLTWNTEDYRSPIPNPGGAGNEGYCTALVSDGTYLYYYVGRSGRLFRSVTGQTGSWTELAGASTLPSWAPGEMYGNAMVYLNMGAGKLAAARLRKTNEPATYDWDKDRMALYDIATNSWSWLNTGSGAAGRLDLNSGFFAIGNYVFGNQHGVNGQSTWRVDVASATFGKAGFSGLTGSDPAWFSRTVMHALAPSGLVYSVKADRQSQSPSTGDILWRWDSAAWANGVNIPATTLGMLPFQIGEGDSLIYLPPAWHGQVAAEGGLFLVRGRGGVGGAPSEGRGPATADFAMYDIAAGAWTTGYLPGLTGAGSSASLHRGRLYIKVGHNDSTGTNGPNDLLYVAAPPPAGACCLADGACAVTTEQDCTGTWHGPESACDPNPCPLPNPLVGWGTYVVLAPYYLTGFSAIAAGGGQNLGLNAAGAVVAWGENSHGQCEVPAPNNGFIAVATRYQHTLGLRSDGSITTWGLNDYGQCDVPLPNSGFMAVGAGVWHSLAIREGGSVVGWGRNDCGQCDVPAPNSGFTDVAGGRLHSLGLKDDGSIAAWGDNSVGQCDVPAPNSDFVALAGGRYHNLGLKTDGSIVAWGDNSAGQCDVPAPNDDFVAISAGRYHSLGLKADGTVVAWGDNGYGQCAVPAPNSGFVAVAAGLDHSLGYKADGTTVAWGDNTYTQVGPVPNSGFVAVAGGAAYVLGLRADGAIAAWGDNSDGECDVPSPNSDFVAVAAGVFHCLGLKSDGSITAWGASYSGQCTVPLPNSDFVAVAAGADYSVGLKGDGTIVAWGNDEYGQCVVPAPNSNFVAVAAGGNHVLGLKDDTGIVAWGWNNSGQCDVPTPNSEFVAVAAGLFHSLGLKADGSIWAWGANTQGECDVPPPNTGFIAIAASGFRSLGLKGDGTIMVWGAYGDGQPSDPALDSGFVSLGGSWYADVGVKGLLGDVIISGHVDRDDYLALETFLTGPDVFPPLGSGPARLDGDWDVDLADFAVFQRAFTGSMD